MTVQAGERNITNFTPKLSVLVDLFGSSPIVP